MGGYTCSRHRLHQAAHEGEGVERETIAGRYQRQLVRVDLAVVYQPVHARRVHPNDDFVTRSVCHEQDS